MADQISFTSDIDRLMRQLAAYPDVLAKHLDPEAESTANAIAHEAARRVARATGKTAGQIRVERLEDGSGYMVRADDPGHSRAPVDVFLEYGTRNMSAQPFFFQAARLEQGDHDRRVLRALQAAADELGLGD